MMAIALDERQKEVVFSDAPYILAVSGPGSGKTTVLASRYARLVEGGVSPDKILAITFTNRAALEMKSRISSIAKIGGDKFSNISTMHGFSFNLIKKKKTFTLYDRRMQAGILKEFGVKNIEDAIDELSAYKNTGKAIDKELFEKYQSALNGKNALDLDDLIVEATRLIEDEPPGFSHVLVDEFQDINPLQARLIKCLTEKGANLFAIGDLDQSIYAFRGANVEGFLNFENDFPGAKVIRLEKNYRSTSTIVNAGNALIERNSVRLNKTSMSQKEGGEPVSVVTCGDEREEAMFIVKEIEGLIGGITSLTSTGGGTYGFADFAVLLRTKRQSLAVEDVFRTSSIPYEIIAVPEGISELIERLRGMKEAPAAFGDFIRKEAESLGMEGYFAAGLSNIARNFSSVQAFMEYLIFIQPEDTYDIASDRVKIMTLHASKGLEFKVVFIAGCEEGLIPLKGADIEEERRLFYVGITRARERVYLLNSKKRRIFGSVVDRMQSPFLREIPDGYINETVLLKKKVKKRPFQRKLFE